MINSIKKIILGVVCLAVLSTGLIVPRTTYAIPVVDGPLNALTFSNAVASAGNWIAQLGKWITDELAKTLRDKLVKAFFDEVTRQTVDWIKNKGKPRFVSDWQGFMKDTVNDAVNLTISQSKLADLCTPFAPQLRIALIPETRQIKETARCTITDIVKNVQGFYDNFQNGGWIAYGEAIKPQNNLYMQMVMFGDETKLKTNFSQDAAKQEAGAGSGFLSVSKCLEDNSQEVYDQCVADSTAEGQASGATDCYAFAAANAICTKKEVQTPGQAVSASVGQIIGSDTQVAQGVQGFLTAIIDASLNRMQDEGLRYLTNKERPGKGASPATGYQQDLDAFSANTKRDMKNVIKPTIEQLKTVLGIKSQTALYLDQTVTNLNSIGAIQSKGVNCPPVVAVGSAEIANATGTRALVDEYMTTLQANVTKAESIVKQIDAMDTNNIRQSSLVNTAMADFASQNIWDKLNAPGGYPQAKSDALDEQSGVSGNLNNVLTRLQTCKDARTFMFTPAI
jgi:hypothetical protein